MTSGPESFRHYNAAWNERDPSRIRAHLDRAVAADVVFADPSNHTVGTDALEELIRQARAALPEAEYLLMSDIDGGHDGRYRYHWEARMGDEPVVGMDVTTVDADGRITRIDGFFNDLPRSQTPREI